MAFGDRLRHFRKSANLTQQALADEVSVAVLQIKKYESGKAQPSLDVIKRLAVALSVTADALIFDESERDPGSITLRNQLAAIASFSESEQAVIISVLDAFIKRHRVEEAMSA
jgi:transcriptional regulator with XRE-family HTH domain